MTSKKIIISTQTAFVIDPSLRDITAGDPSLRDITAGDPSLRDILFDFSGNVSKRYITLLSSGAYKPIECKVVKSAIVDLNAMIKPDFLKNWKHVVINETNGSRDAVVDIFWDMIGDYLI